ncbi:cupin domain-containing protein [Winogradskyella bathintestinalis]|uniref:Cupin domain-containing protein n=1 Tax=Winogradskyella bathintestinalis TaxID=3035208 RepID=A0ABT7ZVC3_9FLAO|nr:cupin domain-containing protein [Winogradskyella bathintestinalis]MDN3492929.1 cupin domain-containing protein [Winogradskyella bathintestinalis]
MKITTPKILKSILILAILLSNCKNKDPLPDPLEAGWKGEAVCEILEDNKELRVLKCTFEPGVGHEKHYHNPHVGYTLVGGKFRITDDTGTRDVDVPAGYTFSKDTITSHEVLNIGETTSVYLIMEYK